MPSIAAFYAACHFSTVCSARCPDNLRQSFDAKLFFIDNILSRNISLKII